jgi:hypothetical protein
MGEEGEKPFRFLTDAEFARLDAKAKAAYLVRAAHELEERQRVLRAQIKIVTKLSGGP